VGGKRCQRCGAALSRFATGSSCPTCEAITAPLSVPVHPQAAAGAWPWISPTAGAAFASRDLGVILRAYRRANRLSQNQLAESLGYDTSYISRLERGQRTISDRATLGYIARHLGVPSHVLGITEEDDADFLAMLQFADSTIRLAGIAREAGYAVTAVNELWPLIARLEARACNGRTERDVDILLAHGRAVFGTALGDVLPEERLATAARWTGRAVRAAERLDDQAALAHALRRHGNELRKSGHRAAAVVRLNEALRISSNSTDHGEALALLARTAGELADADLFDRAVGQAHQQLETAAEQTILFNPHALTEIHMRGLLATGRPAAAASLIPPSQQASPPAAPQWAIIEQVTAGSVLIAAGELDRAASELRRAVAEAEARRLPHQIQRVIRATTEAPSTAVSAVHTAATTALGRLRSMLTP
jgi:transcriptional regulator with XRE-family HTH domain